MIQSILSTALSVLPPQKLGWKKFLGSTTNEHGYEVDEYAEEIEIFGLLQPVPRRLYEYQGLDFQKDFWETWHKVHTPENPNKEMNTKPKE